MPIVNAHNERWQALMSSDVLLKSSDGTEATFRDLFYKYNSVLNNALGHLPPRTHPVQGREDEIDQLYGVLERPFTPIAMLLGKAGVGKTSLVEEFVRQLNEGELDTKLEYKYVLLTLQATTLGSLDTGKIISTLSSILLNMKVLEEAAKKALGDNSIRFVLFIDEIHKIVTILGAGTKIGGDALKETLARAPIRVIAATTHKEYDSTILVDPPLAERFKNIELRELPKHTVQDIVKSWWQANFSDLPMPNARIISEVISANAAYRSDMAEPRRTIDVLEEFVSHIKRKGGSIDEKTMQDIMLKRFNVRLNFGIDANYVFENLHKNIMGQPFALDMWNRLLRDISINKRKDKKRAIMTVLLSGPTGVGKTESVKRVAERIFSEKHTMKIFNMTRYKTTESVNYFLRELGTYIKHHTNAVVLLDEFGKSHEDIKDTMLHILDEGIVEYHVINRENGTETMEASIRNAIIACTTNEGASVFENSQRYSAIANDRRDNLNYDPKKRLTNVQKAASQEFIGTLRNTLIESGEFKPEMLNRFDKIIPYKGLDKGAFFKIAEKIIEDTICGFEEDYDVTFVRNPKQHWDESRFDVYTSDLALFIVEVKAKSDSTNRGGARSIHSAIKEFVSEEISEAIAYSIETGHKRFKIEVTKDSYIHVRYGDRSKGGIVTYAIDDDDNPIEQS
ncbi:AAA family ATPase [Staphylococcus agnetis]|uniref:AAA family ATPase n=1 Tax=Staphylococcus agnetis TaxID=985762 RepID=UPI00208E5C0A|nr:AAA family ATPase [Staphylococcus agnetis]MCO4346297.1 AAA family ATPase [Staphylococcus agnetis]MCO4360627.1 AAA family ATPase [Staphylococcus agnetis]